MTSSLVPGELRERSRELLTMGNGEPFPLLLGEPKVPGNYLSSDNGNYSTANLSAGGGFSAGVRTRFLGAEKPATTPGCVSIYGSKGGVGEALTWAFAFRVRLVSGSLYFVSRLLRVP